MRVNFDGRVYWNNIARGSPLLQPSALYQLERRKKETKICVVVLYINKKAYLEVLLKPYQNGLMLKPYQNGNVTYTITLRDDGGAAFGGKITSKGINMTVNIVPVNNAPFFELSESNLQLRETTDVYLTLIKGFALGISNGPPIPHHRCLDLCQYPDEEHARSASSEWTINNEDLQRISFSLDPTARAPFFQIPPILRENGTLELWITPYIYGDVNVSVQLEDDGGTQHGGNNKSDSKWFQIHIVSVNNTPFFELSDALVQVLEGQSTRTHAATLIANASVSRGPPIPSSASANTTILSMWLSFSATDEASLKLTQPGELLLLHTLVGEVLGLPLRSVALSPSSAPWQTMQLTTYVFNVELHNWPKSAREQELVFETLRDTLAIHYP